MRRTRGQRRALLKAIPIVTSIVGSFFFGVPPLLASQGRVYVNDTTCGANEAVYRPRTFDVSCVSFLSLDQIDYQRWNSRVARGVAVEEQETCKPNCASGGDVATRVSLTFSRPRTCPRAGVRAFTRLTFRPTRAGSSASAYSMPCPDHLAVGAARLVSSLIIDRSIKLPAAAGRHIRASLAASCGTVSGSYDVGHGPDSYVASELRIAVVRDITCRGARAVTARCISDRSVRGWTAHVSRADPGLIRLTSGHKLIRLEGVAGGGPNCATAAYASIGL